MRQHARFFFSILKTKKMPVRQRSTKNLHNQLRGGDPQKIVGKYGQQKTYEVVGTPLKKKKDITIKSVQDAINKDPNDKDYVSTPRKTKELKNTVDNLITSLSGLLDDNDEKKETKTKKEKLKKLAAEVRECIAGYAPCNPLKGTCPPDWENATAYVVKEDIDDNKKTYTYRAPCVVKAGILGPYETKKTDDYHRYLQILRLASEQIPEYEKRFEILNAIQSCDTLNNRPELCERVQTATGSHKCRVDSDNSCKPTLAFLNEKREGVIDRLQSMDSSIKTLQEQLKDPVFDEFRNVQALQSIPDNHETRAISNQFRLKSDKLEKLLQNRINLLQEVLTAQREANGLEQQHALATANDAICQNRKVDGDSSYGDCILATDPKKQLCMIATFGKDREHAYIEKLSGNEDKKMKLDMCVSKDGKGISHIKDDAGRTQFIDQNERIVSKPFGPNPKWWASTRNRVMARGLADAFTTDLSGINTDLSHWTTDKILNRADIRNKRMLEIEKMKQQILDLMDNLTVGYKQLTRLTNANVDAIKTLVNKACKGDKFEAQNHNFSLSVEDKKEKLKTLLGLDGSKTGLVFAMYGWAKKLKDVSQKLDNPESGSTQEMSSLIGFLTERLNKTEKDNSNDQSKDFEEAIIDQISKTAQENHKFGLAHDIALRFAADKFTAGELLYYHPNNDRVRMFDFPNYKKEFILARAVNTDNKIGGNDKFITIRLGNGETHTVGRYHVRKKYITADPDTANDTEEEKRKAGIRAGRTQNNVSEVTKMSAIRKVQINVNNQETYQLDQFVEHAIDNGVDTNTGWFSSMISSVRNKMFSGNKSLKELCEKTDHDTISKLQKELIAMTDTYNNYLKEQGMTTDYSSEYMRTRQARGTNSGVLSWMANYGKKLLRRGSMGLFGGEGQQTSSDEESFMSTDGESILSVSSHVNSDEESFMSTNLSDNISFMSTATPQVSELSFMSTATPQVSELSFMSTATPLCNEVSLMSTATRQSNSRKDNVSMMSTTTPVVNDDVSLMSTATLVRDDGSLMSTATSAKSGLTSLMSTATPVREQPIKTSSLQAQNVMESSNQSRLSTEGGTVSLLSTAKTEQMMASIPSSEEFMSDISSISMPSVKSLAASSVDVDRLYEEYYANASSSSSVSHL